MQVCKEDFIVHGRNKWYPIPLNGSFLQARQCPPNLQEQNYKDIVEVGRQPTSHFH